MNETLEPNPQFGAWRDSMPESHWARYDLSACRLGWEAAVARLDGHWIGTPIEQEVAVWEGLKRVAAERTRQVLVEGYTGEHDEAHDNEELAMAAVFYVVAGVTTARGGFALSRIVARELSDHGVYWPWGKYWKPSDDPIRNLEKAGALIVAEIDRLLRLKKKEENEADESA